MFFWIIDILIFEIKKSFDKECEKNILTFVISEELSHVGNSERKTNLQGGFMYAQKVAPGSKGKKRIVSLSGPHRLDDAGQAPGYATTVFIQSARFEGVENIQLARALSRACMSASPHLSGVNIAPHLHTMG